jgi:hypothetical protein
MLSRNSDSGQAYRLDCLHAVIFVGMCYFFFSSSLVIDTFCFVLIGDDPAICYAIYFNSGVTRTVGNLDLK